MEYRIVHELPGRLRARCRGRRFTEGQGCALERILPEVAPAIRQTIACAINGSLLIHYEPSARAEVLAALDALDLSALPEAEVTGRALGRRSDNAFHWQIACMAARHFICRLFVPAALQLPIALLRYAPFLLAGLRNLREGKLGVPVLDAVSIGTALLTNSTATAGSIMFMLGISERLQRHTLDKTRGALSHSLALRIDRVWLVQPDGTEVSVPLDAVKPGDRVIVRTGSVIPVDGVVERGEAEVNEAFMTGEAAPAAKRAGIAVYAGTTVERGGITVLVRALNEETRISRIMNLIDHAETLKAKVQAQAEHLADRIVPYSLGAAAFTWAATRNATRASAVLMVDYSCALKLSTPITVSSAMREGVNHGFVIKGGKYLEALAEADTIVFDKTGTLTTASPTVSRIIALPPYTEEDVLRTAACIEEHFPHSMARAIVNEAFARGLKHEEEHAEVKFVVAHGVHTTLRGERALVGSAHYVFEDEGVVATPEQREFIRSRAAGMSAIYLALGDRLAGCICLEDKERPEAAAVVAALREEGVRHIIMLTGDGPEAAARVAARLGLDEYRAQVLPEDKADIIRELKAQGRRVVMIGDGVNDSPAMSCADVSISMRDAADLAREVSDITLLGQSIDSLVTLRRLATRCMDRVQSNYRFIVGFNSGLIALGSVGALAPVLTAFFHNLSTIAICLHSIRPLLERPLDEEET